LIDFFSDHAVLFALLCSFVAIGYGIGPLNGPGCSGSPAGRRAPCRRIAARDPGGARPAYLRRQYTTRGDRGDRPVPACWGFYKQARLGERPSASLIGAKRSQPPPVFIGMNVAVRSNVRHRRRLPSTASSPAAETSPSAAGSVTGMPGSSASACLGVAGYYWVLDGLARELFELGRSTTWSAWPFGGSLISVFARLGGGIYTKGRGRPAADLVGKDRGRDPQRTIRATRP